MKNLNLIICSFLLLTILSCKKESTTESELAYSFSASGKATAIGATADATGAIVAEGTNGSIYWGYISSNITKVEFSANLKGEKYAFDIAKPFGIKEFKLDSIVGKSKVPDGVYESLRLQVSFDTGSAIFLSGYYKEISGTQIPLTVQFALPSFVIEIPRVEIKEGAYIGKINLELNALLKGLTRADFGQTDRSLPNNAIVVSTTKNKILYDKLFANLKSIFKGTIVKN